MEDFSVEAVRQMIGGPFFEGSDKVFQLNKATKFAGSKICNRIMKYDKISVGISEKRKFIKKTQI